MGWKVHVILAGEFGPMPEWMRIRTEGVLPGENIPSYIYLIENGKDSLLVDASFSSTEDIARYMGIPCKRENSIEHSLSQFGLTQKDIGIVILSHLHWDHAGGIVNFPNARILCQKAEFEWMMNTHMWEIGYPHWFVDKALQQKAQFEYIDGNTELMDGIKLLHYGGHTPGSQMVQVDCDDGPYIIPGDNIMSYENIERDIPIGLFCNIKECIASLELVKRLNAKCLPSHDWKALANYMKTQI